MYWEPAKLRAIRNLEAKLKDVEKGHDNMVTLKVQMEKQKTQCPKLPASTTARDKFWHTYIHVRIAGGIGRSSTSKLHYICIRVCVCAGIMHIHTSISTL